MRLGIRIEKLNRVRQVTATFLRRNWAVIPHVTHHDEIDVTELDAARKTWNGEHPAAKMTLLIPAIKAVASALRTYPIFNSSLMADGKSLVWKEYISISVAIETSRGLVVGVVRGCDEKSPQEIGMEVITLADKARSKGLSMAEMNGGSMTISSLGQIVGTAFTPIVNAP